LIPSTIGAFIAFLGLAAPGLVFQLARESKRPGYEETTFRELSRVALTSLIFTSISVASLVGLRLVWPRSFIDAHAWIRRRQEYVNSHLVIVTFTLVLEVVLACLIAALVGIVMSRGSRAHISPFGIWYKVLRDERPDGTRPWITLHLTDGTELTGLLRSYTESKNLDKQEIAIGGPHMARRSSDGTLSAIGQQFDAAVVRGDHIQYMIVRYQDRSGQLIRRRTKVSPRGKPAEVAVKG
jgi:hypothetical protein